MQSVVSCVAVAVRTTKLVLLGTRDISSPRFPYHFRNGIFFIVEKVENPKVGNLKVENVKVENVKVENVKVENAKVENVKLKMSKLKM